MGDDSSVTTQGAGDVMGLGLIKSTSTVYLTDVMGNDQSQFSERTVDDLRTDI